MTGHARVLSVRQCSVLRRIWPLLDERGFYLGGGTAVALHLGHRRSVDFDWFTEAPLHDATALAATLRTVLADLEVTSVAAGTLHARASGVRLSFLEYRYPLVARQMTLDTPLVRLASLDDLACMKLSALAQRGARRDFVDLYAIITKHRPLSALFPLYRRKYEMDDVSHFLYALAYFDDAEKERMPAMLWRVSWRTMRSRLQDELKRLSP